MTPEEIRAKNEKFLSQREITNKMVNFREFWFDEDGPMETMRVMEVYDGGKIVPLKIDSAPALEKLISKIKRPGQNDNEKDERIKKMGETISELNRRLKEK